MEVRSAIPVVDLIAEDLNAEERAEWERILTSTEKAGNYIQNERVTLFLEDFVESENLRMELDAKTEKHILRWYYC